MLTLLKSTAESEPAEEKRELQQLLIRVSGGDREALSELYCRTRTAV